jgi:hypothetical protein
MPYWQMNSSLGWTEQASFKAVAFDFIETKLVEFQLTLLFQ